MAKQIRITLGSDLPLEKALYTKDENGDVVQITDLQKNVTNLAVFCGLGRINTATRVAHAIVNDKVQFVLTNERHLTRPMDYNVWIIGKYNGGDFVVALEACVSVVEFSRQQNVEDFIYKTYQDLGHDLIIPYGAGTDPDIEAIKQQYLDAIQELEKEKADYEAAKNDYYAKIDALEDVAQETTSKNILNTIGGFFDTDRDQTLFGKLFVYFNDLYEKAIGYFSDADDKPTIFGRLAKLIKDIRDVSSLITQHLHNGNDEATNNCLRIGEAHWYYYTARKVNGMYEWRTFDNTATTEYVYTTDNILTVGNVAYEKPTTLSSYDYIVEVANDTIAKSDDIPVVSSATDGEIYGMFGVLDARGQIDANGYMALDITVDENGIATFNNK